MNGVHLGSFDLNLLVAFDALLTERSVTRASARIGITQSAASHALARLRKLTDDELLARVGDGMVLTVRAEAMCTPLRRALEDIRGTLSSPPAFDPTTAGLHRHERLRGARSSARHHGATRSRGSGRRGACYWP
jgi:LysR family transcriptional regulator, mexEF-oprN operon transcriptional activator